ncbi:MAG: hypothetical protein AAF682_09825 [Planctomycetota bacterium]
MKSLPSSVVVAGLLCLLSALWGLIQGTMGLELPIGVPGSVAVILALVHVYCGLGLLAGSNYARMLTLWLLGIGLAWCWVDMWGYVRSSAGAGAFAGAITRMSFVSFFLWHLSGPGAVAYSSDGEDHGHGHDHDHGHDGDHAHASQ